MSAEHKRSARTEQFREGQLLDTLLEVSGLLVIVLDEDGTILLFNRACEELTGFRSADMLGESIWSTLIPEGQLADVREVHERLSGRAESRNSFVNHWLTREGDRRLIQWRNAALRDDDGHLVGLVGTGIDVTEQERALHARWHWEFERHYLLDALPVLIAHVDTDFRIRFANDGYRIWFDLEPRNLVGEHISSVIGQEAFETLAPHFNRALSGRRSTYHGPVSYLHGPQRFIHGTYIPAYNEHSKADGFYIVAVDLSDQQRLRQERDRALREAQSHLLELAHATRVAALGEVTAGLAHEISQPLSAIAATAQACLMRLENRPDSVESLMPMLDKIAAQGHRARQIVEQLRAFLRKEHEDVRIDCKPADLINEVLLLLEPELGEAGIRVETDIDKCTGPLRVNRVQIEQVLFNLVRNAIEALEDFEGKRRIVVRCRTESSRRTCRVEVSDSGPGVKEADIPNLFHPFHTTKRQGLGQGLSICRSILERHEGMIEAANHPEGGAIFGFTLPLDGDAGD